MVHEQEQPHLMFPSRAGLKPSKVSRLVSRLNQDAGEEEAEVTIIMNIFMIALSLFLSSMLILMSSWFSGSSKHFEKELRPQRLAGGGYMTGLASLSRTLLHSRLKSLNSSIAL